MAGGKTIGELMEEMRLAAGAKEYHGHTYMDLARFDDKTRHMIIFDVLTNKSPVGWKGERTRLYLSDTGYQEAEQVPGCHERERENDRQDDLLWNIPVFCQI